MVLLCCFIFLVSLDVSGSCLCVLGIVTLFHSVLCSLLLYIYRIYNIIDSCMISLVAVVAASIVAVPQSTLSTLWRYSLALVSR
jgi:hypothetical protein